MLLRGHARHPLRKYPIFCALLSYRRNHLGSSGRVGQHLPVSLEISVFTVLFLLGEEEKTKYSFGELLKNRLKRLSVNSFMLSFRTHFSHVAKISSRHKSLFFIPYVSLKCPFRCSFLFKALLVRVYYEFENLITVSIIFYRFSNVFCTLLLHLN